VFVCYLGYGVLFALSLCQLPLHQGVHIVVASRRFFAFFCCLSLQQTVVLLIDFVLLYVRDCRMLRVMLFVVCGLFVGMQWGCNAIVEKEQETSQKMVVLPVAPEPCQALYRVPAVHTTTVSDLVFPKGATVAEMPATVSGSRDVSCTLVVVQQKAGERRAFWRVRTVQEGVSGEIQCSAEGQTSPTFGIRGLPSQTATSYVYTSDQEQDRVDSFLQAGKMTVTWLCLP
jgi:hypothetical protein